MEEACHARLDVIWLMRGQMPDHSTIADFVGKHRKTLRKLFRNTLQVLIQAEMVHLSHTAFDGSKLEADAGRNSVRSQDNTQLAVDDAYGVIVAADVNDEADDSGQRAALVEPVLDNCGDKPEAISADSQYNTGPDLAAMEQRGIDCYLPDAA